MSLPLQFGRRYTFSSDGEKTSVTEELFVNHQTQKRVIADIETVRLKSEKDFLSECVDLDRRCREGEIDLPGIQMFRDKDGKLRVEKSYVRYEDLTQ